MADGRKHEPGCGKVAWSGRNQHPSNTQGLGESDRVERSGAAEGDQREAARIQPALHRDEAQRVEHMRHGDRANAECRILRAPAHWLLNGLAHHFTCMADIEAMPPAPEVARIEA